MASLPFRDWETAKGALERIVELTGGPRGKFLMEALRHNPDPDRAVANLERWLRATSSPALYASELEAVPKLGTLLLLVLGASQPLADGLIQNPELASLVLDPGEVGRVPTRESIEAEGRRLLQAATSPSHALDRLRFLKQRWTIPIVLNDLSGHWPQPAVWRALSDLADAIITLARDAVWQQRFPGTECPVTIVAFGKLGGYEVNYSSDVDLVYVLPDDADERVERDATRFAESFGRALSDRMGRGALFRVDLRLRPYGGTGAILRRMRSYEGYYDLYAEPWEGQALLRSRPVAGDPETMQRWEAMRVRRCFRPSLGENALSEMLAMRTRIEEFAEENDIKRGKGGIRDIEFTVQILQLAYGYGHPELQVLPTLQAIPALSRAKALPPRVDEKLGEGYTFLRKLEHRLQLLGDQQTHSMPSDRAALRKIAGLMNLGNASELERTLRHWRRTVSGLYESILHPEAPRRSAKEQVMEALGAQAELAQRWIDSFPEADAFWTALVENENSLENVRDLLKKSPVLVEHLRHRLGVTERVLSGEIEEPGDLFAPLEKRKGRGPEAFARAYERGWLGSIVREGSATQLKFDLAAGMDRLIRLAVEEVGGGLTVYALGSWGNQDTGPGSDGDMLLLADGIPQAEAEVRAQALLLFLRKFGAYGARLTFDHRLRPEGGKGLLARTAAGLQAYDLEGMEMWERFALGHARLVMGDPATEKIIRKAADGLPLTPERANELLRMKRRIETERVQPQHIHRDPKLGHGGLVDAEWAVRMLEMRYSQDRAYGTLDERAEALFNAGRMEFQDQYLLKDGRRWLLEVRNTLWLLGFSNGIIPENPERLDGLADAMGIDSANLFLKYHETATRGVREAWVRTMRAVVQ